MSLNCTDGRARPRDENIPARRRAADIHVETRGSSRRPTGISRRWWNREISRDLFFRLGAIRVVVPPLRERPEDIPPLIDHFIAHWNQEFGRNVKGPTDEALELMLAYRWPGNVRELRNVLERAILLESDESILPEHLPVEVVSVGGSGPRVLETRLHAEGGVTTLAQAERIAIEMALAKASGNKTRAAEALGISRQTLRTKLKEYRIEAPAVHVS
jgi:transcriptional regulator with PAS, ATPase and Fis domain